MTPKGETCSKVSKGIERMLSHLKASVRVEMTRCVVCERERARVRVSVSATVCVCVCFTRALASWH